MNVFLQYFIRNIRFLKDFMIIMINYHDYYCFDLIFLFIKLTLYFLTYISFCRLRFLIRNNFN